MMCGDHFGMIGEYNNRVVAVVFTLTSMNKGKLHLTNKQLVDIGFGNTGSCGPYIGPYQPHQITILDSTQYQGKVITTHITEPIEWSFSLYQVHTIPSILSDPETTQLICTPYQASQHFRLSHYPQDFTALWLLCHKMEQHPLMDFNVMARCFDHLLEFDYTRLFTIPSSS